MIKAPKRPRESTQLAKIGSLTRPTSPQIPDSPAGSLESRRTSNERGPAPETSPRSGPARGDVGRVGPPVKAPAEQPQRRAAVPPENPTVFAKMCFC
jgi:hypothetical protein